jgi:putative IMPACT (imprinted ancient) family translation regulator
MRSIEQYRAHARDCLQRAHADANEGDKPLWLTLAQSWLQLAEHAHRVRSGSEAEETVQESEDAAVD